MPDPHASADSQRTAAQADHSRAARLAAVPLHWASAGMCLAFAATPVPWHVRALAIVGGVIHCWQWIASSPPYTWRFSLRQLMLWVLACALTAAGFRAVGSHVFFAVSGAFAALMFWYAATIRVERPKQVSP